MALPKIITPKFAVKIPSTGKEVTFRPFLVKEEKALLIAVESQDQDSIIRSIKDAISACVEDVDVSKLPYFDVEFLFLNLRAKSVGEEVKFTYRHRGGVNREGVKCDHATEVSIKIDEVAVKHNADHVDKFMIDDKLGLKMKYPTIDSIRQLTNNEKNEIALMASCIEYVYDSENVFPPDTLEESIAFIESMNTGQYEKITKFFETMPKLNHEIEYTCNACKQVDKVTFEGVAEFF
jgi:hypothetical protein